MALPRLSTDGTVLLVVDVQERLMPTIDAAARVEANCAILARAAGVLGMPVVCTEQYVKGLGHTTPHVRGALPAGAKVFEKTRFSALVPPLADWLAAHGRRQVVLCGVEAHVCVLQTALDLRAAGCTPFLATDAISAGQPQQIGPALRRLDLAGCIPTGCLSAMYELAQDASNPLFKGMLGLAKAIRQLPA